MRQIKSRPDEEKINMSELIARDAIKPGRTPGARDRRGPLYTQTNAIVKGAEKEILTS